MVLGWRPGLAPAGEALFFASPKKSTQKKGDPTVCGPCGASCVGEFAGCAVELATRCALHSDNHGESDVEACVSCGTHATPQTPRHRRIQMGRCTTGLCFARPRADEARQRARPGGPSVAMARDHPVEAGPRSAGFGGSGIALFERSEFSETPPNPSTAGCPVAQRRGPRRRVAFLLGTFLWRSKEKCLGRRAETRPPPSAASPATTPSRYAPVSPPH